MTVAALWLSMAGPLCAGLIINPYTFVVNITSPTEIAGCLVWLDANQIIGLSDGDPVATWDDASGNNIDAAQATGGLQPSYQTGELNSKPIVRFDGGDRLTGSSASLIDLSRSYFVVTKQTTATGEDCIFDVGSWAAITADGASWKFYGATANLFTGSNLAWSIVSIVQDSTTGGGVFVDGVSALVLGNANASGGGGSFAIGDTDGSSLVFTGDMAEIIIYDSKLSDSDRAKVERYLGAKYGISIP